MFCSDSHFPQIFVGCELNWDLPCLIPVADCHSINRRWASKAGAAFSWDVQNIRHHIVPGHLFCPLQARNPPSKPARAPGPWSLKFHRPTI